MTKLIWILAGMLPALAFAGTPDHSMFENEACTESRGGPCFAIRGRLSISAGLRTRLWVVGTDRVLSIVDDVVPDVIAKHLSPDVRVYGDFFVCPRERDRPGVMRPVCLRSGINLVRQQVDLANSEPVGPATPIAVSSKARLPELELGDMVPSDATKIDNNIILVSPACFQDLWRWSFDGVEYELGVDDSGFVQFISTRSTRVSTPEGVRVGTRWVGLQTVPGARVGRWPGWAEVADLPSGWKAGAYFSDEKTPRGPQAGSASVQFLFKGTGAGYGQRGRNPHAPAGG